jgi:hypothetical protein
VARREDGKELSKRFIFADCGEHALCGFKDPVRLYEARWRDA